MRWKVAFWVSLLLIFSSWNVFATSLADTASSVDGGNNGIRISLLTIGQGRLATEALGHVCIRVIDSSRTDEYRDVVFNYGTFDYEAGFEKKMISGDLLFSLAAFPYDFFLHNFVSAERSLTEQEMLFNNEDKVKLVANLVDNALPQNKYYHYDFFDDNCSNRIYYLVVRTFGDRFRLGHTLPSDKVMTYYDLCNPYYGSRYWERVAEGLLFAGRLRKEVTNEAAVFLPACLSRGFGSSLLDGQPFCAPGKILQQGSAQGEYPINAPLWISVLLALLALSGLFFPRLGRLASVLIPFGTGILGCLLVFAWVGTRHAGFENNLNPLWALPTGLFYPFLRGASRWWYTMIALGLLFVVVLMVLVGLHTMPIAELSPLLLSLVVVYANSLRR